MLYPYINKERAESLENILLCKVVVHSVIECGDCSVWRLGEGPLRIIA